MSELKKIVYLGPKGSYTEIAAKTILSDGKFEKFFHKIHNSIINVIKDVNENPNYTGILPIENSIEGIVRETIDNLLKTRNDLYITKEIIIPISHCLISKSKNINDIKKIMSIGQAIAQCSHYLASNFSNAELITTSSTSEAVRLLEEFPDDYAAIGNSLAAELYGFNILARKINDIQENKTRFVSLDSFIPISTGNDKTSIAFTASNEPGSLVNILLRFKESSLNLSYIESRPSKNVFGNYTFFIDFDGHIEDENVKETIDKITPLVSSYKFLGSYPKFEKG